MPTRVNPKWGWTGAVRYASLGERNSHDEYAGEQRLPVYRPPTGAHCDELLKDLGLTFLEGQRTACHEQLKWIHEFGF